MYSLNDAINHAAVYIISFSSEKCIFGYEELRHFAGRFP